MPKIKTLKAAKKRFSQTAKGKIKYKKSGMRHLLSKQKSRKKQDLKRSTYLRKGQEEMIKKMLVNT